MTKDWVSVNLFRFQIFIQWFKDVVQDSALLINLIYCVGSARNMGAAQK
jgi:hypothetical protein